MPTLSWRRRPFILATSFCPSSSASCLILFKHLFFLPSGHLSAQRVAQQVQHSGRKAGVTVSSYIEELVVRRELTDNFCFYNKKYDSVEGQLILCLIPFLLHFFFFFFDRLIKILFLICVCGTQVHMSGLRRPWEITPKTRGHIYTPGSSWRKQRHTTNCGTLLRYNI